MTRRDTPGPVPKAHARHRLWETTASSWRTWPKLNARKSSQRRRGHYPVTEHPANRPRPQAVSVADVAGTGDHGMHEGQYFAARLETRGPGGEVDRGVYQRFKAHPGHQRGHHDQPGVGYQSWVVEGHLDAVKTARYWLH
jgi:hypothetical protein